ncbi:MAG: hypothetical protein KatS3mg131_3163 [Candidatus Tectimicrobiota bacterium]|nr:MAG: hypothetical protein KatS3mg131_3163 [Candidatus Tectomicrobia bacterium]
MPLPLVAFLVGTTTALGLSALGLGLFVVHTRHPRLP